MKDSQFSNYFKSGSRKLVAFSEIAVRKLNIWPISECSHDHIFVFLLFEESFKSSVSTVSLPFAWQSDYLLIHLLLVFFFLLKGLLSEPLKILKQYWKQQSGQSTA